MGACENYSRESESLNNYQNAYNRCVGGFDFINQRITYSIQRTGHNLIYTPADDEYVGRGGEMTGKLRRANKGLNRRGVSGATAEDAEEAMANDKMIRRKLIAEDQILINDSEDATSEQMEEDSYINVMVSWLSSHPFRSPFYEINFCRNKFKTNGRRNLDRS